MKTSTDLLACPFCGHVPTVYEMRYVNTGRVYGYRLECGGCGLEIKEQPVCWPAGKDRSENITCHSLEHASRGERMNCVVNGDPYNVGTPTNWRGKGKEKKMEQVAISIRQPWAWLILNAGKNIENRTWPTRFRGRLLIHASKGCTQSKWADAHFFMNLHRLGADVPEIKDLDRGGIVGECEIVDCVTASDSPWFVGQYGFVLRNVKPLPFRACKGALGFFKVK